MSWRRARRWILVISSTNISHLWHSLNKTDRSMKNCSITLSIEVKNDDADRTEKVLFRTTGSDGWPSDGVRRSFASCESESEESLLSLQRPPRSHYRPSRARCCKERSVQPFPRKKHSIVVGAWLSDIWNTKSVVWCVWPEILSRDPIIIIETDIVKFFLNLQSNVCILFMGLRRTAAMSSAECHSRHMQIVWRRPRRIFPINSERNHELR